jgi:hypothetical protein
MAGRPRVELAGTDRMIAPKRCYPHRERGYPFPSSNEATISANRNCTLGAMGRPG